jgi:hypothetical protein
LISINPLPYAATGFFTLAASGWRMIIGYARVSTTEQNLGLQHDDLKPATDASVHVTNSHCNPPLTDFIKSTRIG